MRLTVAALAAVLLALPQPSSGSQAEAGRSAVRVVVIDPGHGGPDWGARGPSGLLEKEVALSVGLRVGRRLAGRGIQVVYTREADEFVSLADRTRIANRARGDLLLSIHVNSARSRRAEGAETYFLSVEASDDEAMAVAMTENQVFRQEAATPDSGDIVGAILGDLIRTEYLRGSSEVARSIQRGLAAVGPGRGVKQAPFVVLMGVNMPAVLVELGFLSHPDEEARLGQRRHQRAIADAIASAVVQYRDARVGQDGEVASE